MNPSAANAPPGDKSRRGRFSALNHTNYRYYFFSQLLSLTGSWSQTTAMMWLSYQEGQQSIWPALIAAMQVLPGFFLGPWGGSLADRFPRRPLILVTQSLFLVQSMILFWGASAGFASPGFLIALAAVWGIINAIDLPARLSFLVELVGKEDLFNAVALNSLQFNLARLAGPAIGALLLHHWGPEACFLFNAATFPFFLLALLAMKLDPPVIPPAGVSANSWKDGWRFLFSRPDLVRVLWVAGFMALLGWPLLSLFPAYVEKSFTLGKEAYGTLLSCVGGGALLAALSLAWLGNKAPRARSQALGMLLAGFSLIWLSLCGSFSQAIPGALFFGAGMIFFFATSQGMMQLGAADAHRGFVLGIWSMLLCGAVPLGNFLAGPLADRVPMRWVLAGQGVGIWLVLLVFVALKRR